MSTSPDEYASGVYRWWHLSSPSPELLEVLDVGLLPPVGRALDLGCGLGVELAELVRRGYAAVGVDLSVVAIERARQMQPEVEFHVADVMALPFPDESFDLLLDRGCFHYLPAADRSRYESAAWRLLRPGGRFLLRACLTSAGKRNDMPEDVASRHFARWNAVALDRRLIASDTGTMDAVVALLEKPG